MEKQVSGAGCQVSGKIPNTKTYDGDIVMIQSTLNVAMQAIEEAFKALEALKIRRGEEKDGQFSLL